VVGLWSEGNLVFLLFQLLNYFYSLPVSPGSYLDHPVHPTYGAVWRAPYGDVVNFYGSVHTHCVAVRYGRNMLHKSSSALRMATDGNSIAPIDNSGT